MGNVIGIRISRKEKAGLAKIAALKGLSLSAFLRTAAVTEAHRVLGPPKLVNPEPEK